MNQVRMSNIQHGVISRTVSLTCIILTLCAVRVWVLITSQADFFSSQLVTVVVTASIITRDTECGTVVSIVTFRTGQRVTEQQGSQIMYTSSFIFSTETNGFRYLNEDLIYQFIKNDNVLRIKIDSIFVQDSDV